MQADARSGETYTWGSLPGAARYLGGNKGDQAIIDWRTTPPGTYPLTVNAENDCGKSAPLTFAVTVTPQPEILSGINGPAKLCAGARAVYSVAQRPGVDYDWQLTPQGANLTSLGSVALVTWSQPGIYTLEVEPGNNCGAGAAARLRVEVVKPPQVSAGADRVVCGPNTVLTGSPSGGAWQCLDCVPGESVAAFGPYGIVSGLLPETRTFIYEIQDPVCGAFSDTVRVTNGLPAPGRVLSDQTICAGGGGALQLAGYAPSADIVRWEKSYDGFTGTVSTINNKTPALIFSNLQQSAQFRAVLKLHQACGERHSAHATINVVEPDTAPPAPVFQEVCGETATVAGAGAGKWSFVSGPLTPVWNQSGGQLIASGMRAPGLYRFEWKNHQAPCPAKTYVAEILKKQNIRPDAGPNTTTCNSATVLAARQPLSGQWSFVSGPNGANITTSGTVGVATNLFAPGDYVFRWTPGGATCASPAYDEVVVRRLHNPTQANAGSDKIVCNSSVTLYGNKPAHGAPEWMLLSGPAPAQIATFDNIGQVTGMTQTGEYVFRYVIRNGKCAPSTSEVKVTRLDGNIQAVAASANIEICDQQAVSLNADPAPASANGGWQFLSGPANAAIQGAGANVLATNLTQPGTYVFRWTVASPCGSDRADVYVRRYESGAAPPDAGANVSVCAKSTALLKGSAPPSGTAARWDFVSGPVPATVSQFGSFASVNNMSAPGDYVFSWTFDNGACPAETDLVTVTRAARPDAAAAGADQRLCADNFLLQGNTPANGTAAWRQISGPANVSLNSSGASAAVSGATVPGQYVFRYEIKNPPCPTAADNVRITVDAGSNPGALSGARTVCAGANLGQLLLSGYDGDILRWEASEDNFATAHVIDRELPSLTFLNLSKTTQYRAVVKAGACGEAVSNTVEITVTPNTDNIEAGANQTLCGATALLNGSGLPNGIQGAWSLCIRPGPADSSADRAI